MATISHRRSGPELSAKTKHFQAGRPLAASLIWLMTALFLIALRGGEAQTVLTSLNYRITGTALVVTPSTLSVPKGIPGSVLPLIESGGSTNNAAVAKLVAGAYVQAIIRGPGFPTPQRLIGQPNAPLLLPPIALDGNYELDSIALVDATTGQVRMEGTPSTVPINVFDQVLVSTVTSQPLTIDQIQQAGIDIDESNFRAVQFNVSFVLNGQTIPVSFPVVSPTFTESTELIPEDEVEAKLQQAAAINQQIASTVVQLPPALQTAGLNIQMQGINFQDTDPSAVEGLGLNIPPIPALMVIPGNIGYLHQFFSVKIFTENGSPLGSGLSVDNIQATLALPPGPDGIVSTNYNQPGDDPLRFARIGPNDIIEPVQPVVDPGPDGVLGTADDISRLQPGETGQGEFLVEGLQEGLAVMNVSLTGDLYGLVAGVVHIKGEAAGSVLVRNPSFSITFLHPDTVRVGEPYTASITVMNTSVTPANLVSVGLNKNSISGAMLATGQAETIQLGTILPGQSATATYNMVSERTGQITFSDLTTSDDSLTGSFRFSMGVDAQGVPLSPDTIAMPDYVNYLPADLVAAGNRVLGQALSISTAAQLPPGIAAVDNAIITRRVLDMAEAGQRVQYGDPLKRVLADLLRDWQGGRVPDDGFDSLLRTSDAGAEWRSVLMNDMDIADGLTGTQRLLDRAPDLAGLGQQFVIGSAGPGQLRLDFSGGTNTATAGASSQAYAMVYASSNSEWAVTSYLTNAVFTWTFTNGPAQADMAVLIVNTNGQAQQFRWLVPNPPVTAVYHFSLADPAFRLQVDTNGDGAIDSSLAAAQTVVHELPPAMVAVQQDLTVLAGRPSQSCYNPPAFLNYGTVLAVVYSKPMTQATAGATNSYQVDNNNAANSVQIQPSGRVALMNLEKGVSAIHPRNLTVLGVTDVRGNPLVSGPVPIQCYYPGTTNQFTGGVGVMGRVLRGDGSPCPGVPVTLTMYDKTEGSDGCDPWTRRVSQVLTDSGGNFNFDYVMSGIPYSISASDTSDLSSNVLQAVMQSMINGQPDPGQFQQLLASATNTSSILSDLSAGSVPQAVALVEGLDRAVVNDDVGLGSGREGQEVPIVLRFRGRATVTGQVVASDGVTPVRNAAVNLYPDPSSAELGRGVFSDANGQFSFPGIPLGVYSIQVATADQRGATVLGVLDTPNESTNIIISLPDQIVLYSTIQGQVFDSDNITPVPNAQVYLGHYNGGTIAGVVAMATADSTGSWIATNVPIQNLDVVAVTFDGKRKGERTGINPVANQPNYVNVALDAATTVFGQVLFDDGTPATNALVAGGAALVYSDALGNFQLQGVPVGSATISAGLQANPAAGIAFTRLGSTSTTIIAGSANYVVVKLRPAGRIYGTVYDAQGNPQGNVEVAIPEQGGFYWTDADANGRYEFDNLGLGSYTVSAPGNAVAPQLDASALDAQISSGNEDQILAAFQQAVTVFVGTEDPLINGEGLNFAPSSWGYTTADINFDGASIEADIRYIPQGTVTGTVLNGQGIPIGAEVRLTGLGPDTTGAPVETVRGDTTSDPATGQFGFTNVLLAGPWGLQAASPFYPVVIQTNGFTTILNLNVSGVVLHFPPINDVNGRIAGHVYLPDGTLVGQGAQVNISIASDYQILTDTNGYFDTQTEFPAGGYTVTVFDPVSGLQGTAGINTLPGITNFVDVHLLSRNSTVQVTVLRANGLPAVGAQLEVDEGTFPNDAPLYGLTDTNGMATFTGLWEGNYSVMAQYEESSTRLYARAGGTVGANQTLSLTLHMGATGTVKGNFVKQDLVTPVYGAEVAIGNLGFSTTDTNGNFEFDGVPMGTFTVTSSDPVTGGNAQNSVTLNFNGQTQMVQLVEATLGVVNGLVMNSYGTGFVAGASVTISFSDGLTPSRTVTTGPNGGFNFPGSPMGGFNLYARYSVPGAVQFNVTGQANGVLSANATNVSVNIQLQPLTSLAVHVVQHDGVTPANNALVTVGNAQENTDPNGNAYFSDLLAPDEYTVTAISRLGGDLSDGVATNVTVTTVGTNSTVNLKLPGVGNVTGTVVGSDGVTPVENAQVIITCQAPLFGGQTVTALSDVQGHFSFTDVPLGDFLLTASSLSLSASENGTLIAPGQTNQLTLRLGNSGTILGEVVRADGVTPVGGEDVLIQFTSQSSNPGRAVYYTGPDGKFQFNNVPLGVIQVSSAAPDFGGLINFSVTLTNNGQVLNLGLVPYDETLPEVDLVTPTNGTVGVPITNSVFLYFNKALDTNTVNSSGIFITGTNGTVAATVQSLRDTNGDLSIVEIKPSAPLQSLQTYQVIVLAGDLFGAGGSLVGSGPADLVGREMAAPFSSTFTTADNTPPYLLSIFPSNNAVQIDPTSVPRLVFNKTLNSTSFVFTVTGPNGPVPGTPGLGINGQVMTFLPTVNLPANETFTMTVSNVFDLAGNYAIGQPYVATFATLDTIGPTIATLSIVSNMPPTAGALVQVQATLAGSEPNASVRFTQDFNPLGTATNPPFAVLVQLPTTGSTTIEAIGIDQYGNEGQATQVVINVQLPSPPAVQFALVSPTNTPIPSSSTIFVDVTATSDTTISNITGIIGGAATGTLTITNGSILHLEGVVQSTATTNQEIQVFAQAIDSLGYSSGEQVFTLPISDGTAPLAAFVGLTNYAHIPAGTTFNLPVFLADNSSNVTATLAVSGAIAFNQTVPVALTPNVAVTNIFAVPLSSAPTNGGIVTATLTVTDAATNTTVITRNYLLPYSVGPAISSLVIVSNLPAIGGLTVPVEAFLANYQPGTSVRFTQDSNLLGIVTNQPYLVLVQLPASGSTVIQAIATDQYGDNGVLARLIITIEPNVPPSIQFNRVTPASGPIPSGSSFTVAVNASGNSNLFNITGTIGGAASPANFSALAASLTLPGSVPANVVAGQQVQITAQAVDGLGQSTGTKTLNIPTSDGTPPSLNLLSPDANAQLTPNGALSLVSLVADNSSEVKLHVITVGFLAATQDVTIPLTPNVPATNVVNFALPPEPTNGSPLTVVLTATDDAGNSTVVSQVFWLPGTETTVIWERQALGQTFTCTNGGASYTWPNNNNWSQSAVFGDPCSSGNPVLVQPSNWSTTNYPDGTNLDVVLGGIGGTSVTLDVPVTLHSLTIGTNGGLTMANGTSLTAINYDFQGDGQPINRNSYTGTLLLDGGTMDKSGGTNSFTFDGGINLISSNGTFEVDSGSLVLNGNNNYYTNGTFNVDSNASLVLTSPDQNMSLEGNFNGAGGGAVLLTGGGLTVDAGGATFDFPGSLFQWAGGTITAGNPLTNAGVISITSSNKVVLSRTSQFDNVGVVRQDGPLGVDLQQNATVNNLPGADYNLQTDTGLYSDDYNPETFNNFGTVQKSGGTNDSVISQVAFNNYGLVDVETGTLTLANKGSSSNAMYQVAAGAVLDVTGGGSPTWAGNMTGIGAGTVAMESGVLSFVPSVALNFTNGLFQWVGGNVNGVLTNENVVSLDSSNRIVLQRYSAFYNSGLVVETNTGWLDLQQSSEFENQPSATYNLASDAYISSDDYNPESFDNFGTFVKSGGTGNSVIQQVLFNNRGLLDVENGTLTLANNGTSSNATLHVAFGAVLDVTGGSSPTWMGTMTGRGAGTVALASGLLTLSPAAVLDFTNGLFQWVGGDITGLITNLNVMTIDSSNTVQLRRSTVLNNLGLVVQTNTGWLDLQQNAAFENLPSGTYDLVSDSTIFSDDYNPESFDNYGTFRKAGGTGPSGINQVLFNNYGLLDVASGNLTLANNGTSSNAIITVAAGSVLDISGGQNPTWAGLLTGRGAGLVALQSGLLTLNPNATLNFTNGMFQWTGGRITGDLTNANGFTIAPSNTIYLTRGTMFNNAGVVWQTNTGWLDIQQGGRFENLVGGTYNMSGGTAIFSDDYNPEYFDNFGTFRKAGGATSSAVNQVQFNNFGLLDVESGNLTLSNGGSSSNGTYTVAAGSVLDITGGQSPTWAGTMTGHGAGQISFANGNLNGTPSATLNFDNGLFQWTGGIMIGVFANANVVTISGTNSVVLERSSLLNNLGVVRQTGAALNVHQNARFVNLPTGVYDFESGGGVFSSDYAPDYFDNYGTIRKSGGTNTSTISISFANQNGSIEVDQGVLSLGNNSFVQGTGVVTVKLGGTNFWQYGQLNVASALLGGELSVELASGYVPAVGDQFEILSSPNINGTFGSAAVPGGMLLSYSNNGVYLTVTGAVTQLPPSIVTQPLNVTNVAGATISFQVSVAGSAPFGFAWQFNGTNLSDNSHISGSQSGFLTINSISAADVGGYKVIVTNALGSVTSQTATLTILPTASYSYLVTTTPQLVGYWPFSPASQANSVFGGITGTFMGNAAVGAANSGPTLPDQPANTAVVLDGNGDYVATSLSGGLNPGGPYPDQATIIAWFNMDSLPSLDGHTFYIAGESYGGNDLDLQIDTDNTLRFYTDSGGSTANSRAFTSADTNAWHFVAASFIAGFLRDIYLDGVLVGISTPGGHDATRAGEFTMGESPVWTGRFFHGALDEIAFYNRQLSATEINNLYVAAGFTPVAMQIHQAGKFVVLTWTVPSTTPANPHTVSAVPATGTNYVLETATSLRPGTVWQPFGGTPVINGNTFQLSFPVTNSVQFFRLRAK